MKVSVALLSWNGRHHLEECLSALKEQEDPGVEWETLVLDNGSQDGTGEWVRAEHPWVRLIESPHNLGFCLGNNRLVEAAEGDAIALLNNDTRPRGDWLGELVAALDGAPSDVAAVSGRLVDWEGDRLDFARGAMTFDGHAFQVGYGRPLDDVELPEPGEELFFACGGNLLIRREVYRELGGFEPAFFAYLEDVDLGWRLWSAGHRVLAAPGAVAHHRSMATSDLLGLYNRGFLFERNAFFTVLRNLEADLWERWRGPILLTLLHRVQTLLVENNPGTGPLTWDPYAGLIANTAPPADTFGTPGLPSVQPTSDGPTWGEKWRAWGTRGLARRGVRKALRKMLPRWVFDDADGEVPRLVDGRTIGHLRAVHQILGRMDRFAASRERIQAARLRSDHEILERFPPWLVPTYPGDARLFADPGFRSWLPETPRLVERDLEDVIGGD